MTVILNKTTKFKGKFVLAGKELEVSKDEKKKLEKAGFIDLVAPKTSSNEKQELTGLKTELANTNEAFKQLETELQGLKDELAVVKDEKEFLEDELETLKTGTAENPDLLGKTE